MKYNRNLREAEVMVRTGEAQRIAWSSVHRAARDNAAYLKLWEGQPKLNYDHAGDAAAGFGSASRGDCLVQQQLSG